MRLQLDASVDVPNDSLEADELCEENQVLVQDVLVLLQLLGAHHDLILLLF